MIKKITHKKILKIIETGNPEGLFYLKENGVYVGIDNSTGDAWVEEFDTKEECIKWLEGEVAWLNGEEEENANIEDKQLQIMNYYGEEKQLDQLIEESAELIKAICKYKRFKEEKISTVTPGLIEEMADVENLIEQFKLKNETIRQGIEAQKEYKVNREIGRISRRR